tara:strand:+ start:132 stop:956 length:825 start_codon:yes stop_codon:yes gene_type:complete
MKNINNDVVNDFGDEWEEYNQSRENLKLEEAFIQYFSIFPDKYLNTNSIGFDAGCGSGRWAKFIAPKVKKLYCFDPSKKALQVAQKNLSNYKNCSFECASINDSSIRNESMDFGYCLGVLHHLPDTFKALEACVSKLKKNSPLLIYIYYKFDNKPLWFKFIWKLSDLIRKLICNLPFKKKLFITKLIAIFVYYPLARLSLIFEIIGFDVSNFPLSDYRKKTFYFMSTDSLDRFGTKLELRFTKSEINSMMKRAGLSHIKFSEQRPFWLAIGYKN